MKAMMVALAVATSASLALADITPVPNGLPQSLSDGQTYRYGATVTYTPVGSTGLSVLFGQGPQAPNEAFLRATMMVDEGIADSPFHGNYIARSINTIQFQIATSGYVPETGMLMLRTATRFWTYDFRSQVSTAPGVPATILIPLVVTGWKCGVTVPNAGATFVQDIQNITSVRIILDPTDAGLDKSPEQSYTVTSCVLVNDDGLSSKPGNLTPLEAALLAHFGYGYGSVNKLTDAMKAWDADGDGMFDFMEIWAENDSDYANSIFAAEDIQVGPDGVDVTWTCVKGVSYTVLRSSALTGAFSPVAALTGLVATDTGYMTDRDVSAAGQAGPFYYRIRKD